MGVLSLVLVGVTHDDGPEEIATTVRKIAELRIMAGETSVTDSGGAVLVVSAAVMMGTARGPLTAAYRRPVSAATSQRAAGMSGTSTGGSSGVPSTHWLATGSTIQCSVPGADDTGSNPAAAISRETDSGLTPCMPSLARSAGRAETIFPAGHWTSWFQFTFPVAGS